MFEDSSLLLQIQPNETPIKMYSVVHTGAKIQLGGLKKGLFRSTYQVEIELDVEKPEMNPINKQKIIDRMIFEAVDSFIIAIN